MNKAKLIAHIDNPATLFNTSYEELKTLSIQYPYNANLKYLLLNKSRLENNHEIDKNLHLAAVYSIDRAYLRRLMQSEVTTKDTAELLNEEDVLELKDPKTLAWDIEQLKGESLAARPASVSDDTSQDSPAKRVVPDDSDRQRDNRDENEVSIPSISPRQSEEDEVLRKIEDLNREIEQLDLSRTTDLDRLSRLTAEIQNLLGRKSPMNLPKPEAVSEKTTKARKVSVRKKKKETEKKPDLSKEKEKEVTKIAGKSVERNESMASETLALLLEKQGLFQEAIEMYEQLILTFPKKKAFFAAKIKSLKK